MLLSEVAAGVSFAAAAVFALLDLTWGVDGDSDSDSESSSQPTSSSSSALAPIVIVINM